MFTGRKLPLTLVFVGLIALTVGVSCRGFFVQPTLTSIAINPTAPQVDVGQNVTLNVYGTYDDGSRAVINSGIGWSSDTPTVATIGASNGILSGLTPGSTTVTASAQALSTTASATVLLADVTAITVTPTTQTATIGGQDGTFNFVAIAGGTSVPLTTANGGVVTISPDDGDIACDASGNQEVCSATQGAVGPYQIVMTYPGTNASATATLSVNQ